MALSPDPEFDIDRHRLAESRWFEDFTPGERFVLPSRTMTRRFSSSAARPDNLDTCLQ